jgi:deoxyribodipyrimidine photo-lyase
MSTAIWWIRRDLRLADNVALTAALAQATQVLPVWIFDPALLASPYVGEKRLAFLLAGLRALEQELQARGSRLIVRRGRPPVVLAQLLAETGAGVILAEEDYSPYARRRDQAVAQALPLRLVNGVAIQPPAGY